MPVEEDGQPVPDGSEWPDQPYISFSEQDSFSFHDGCQAHRGVFVAERNGAFNADTQSSYDELSCIGAFTNDVIDQATTWHLLDGELVLTSNSGSTLVLHHER